MAKTTRISVKSTARPVGKSIQIRTTTSVNGRSTTTTTTKTIRPR